MTKYAVIYPISGATLYAYPVDRLTYPLNLYTTHRVLLTETDKLYEGEIDLSKAYKWVVFEGTSQPISYDESLFEDVFVTGENIADGGISVNITPASFSYLNRGDKSFIRLYYKETKLVTIPVNGDYTGVPIRLVIEDELKSDVLVIPDALLNKTPTTISATITTAVTDHSTYKRFIWAIRRVSNNENLISGTIVVEYAPF